MNKKLNLTFFSICFLVALLLLIFSIYEFGSDPFSVTGMSVVVIITGYLLLESIKSQWTDSKKKTLFFLEKLYKEETEKWEERFSEVLNIQKASYVTAKKSQAMLEDKLEDIKFQLNSIEKNNVHAIQKLIELQKKAMEGQKNALNLQVNYNKENTKQLIKVLKEESERLDYIDQISLILSQLEKNHALLQDNLVKTSDISDRKQSLEDKATENVKLNASAVKAEIEEDMNDSSNMDDEINQILMEDEEKDSSNIEEKAILNETKDFSGEDDYQEENASEEEIDDLMNLLESSETSDKADENDENDETAEHEDIINDLLANEDIVDNSETETKITDSMASETETESLDITDSETESKASSEEEESVIVPLYDDPNKALSADEIAALFASYGK
ncbi:hypothetical protein I5677_13685 [Mobilitalea sibirica]|uniref:Uncharacterized protein n=1 Tax=Mobilitalea sibirica TaxID=1462919 RepID=A0A8J7L374_9FIRM|nr:hypothetical protein [Mobilitalea sibirica]MBH1941948.1 hypothetical protein [Mobilitalea sibirica]